MERRSGERRDGGLLGWRARVHQRPGRGPVHVFTGWDPLEALTDALVLGLLLGAPAWALIVRLGAPPILSALGLLGALAALTVGTRFRVEVHPDRIRLARVRLGALTVWRRELPPGTVCECYESWEAEDAEGVSLRPHLPDDPLAATDYVFGPAGDGARSLCAALREAIAAQAQAQTRRPSTPVPAGVQRRRIAWAQSLHLAASHSRGRWSGLVLRALGFGVTTRRLHDGAETLIRGHSRGDHVGVLDPLATLTAYSCSAALALAVLADAGLAFPCAAALLLVAVWRFRGPRYELRVSASGIRLRHVVLGIPVAHRRLPLDAPCTLDRCWEWPGGTAVTLRNRGRSPMTFVFLGTPASAALLHAELHAAIRRHRPVGDPYRSV